VARFSPESLDEVAALLLAAEGRAVARMQGAELRVESEAPEERLLMALDLGRLPELNGMEFDERAGLRLGAAVVPGDLAGFPPLHRHYPALADGLEALPADSAARSLGELLGQREPPGHLVCPLACLWASVAVFGPHGWSEMALEALRAGRGRGGLLARDFLVDLRLPAPPPCGGGAYLAQAGATPAGAAAFLVMEGDRRTCCGARLALWQGEEAAARLPDVERFLAGKRLEEPVLREAAALAADARLRPPGAGLPLAAAIRKALARAQAPGSAPAPQPPTPEGGP